MELSPVAKIVASPTDTTWAQAYSAGKLHVVLSLSGQSSTAIASLGRETHEKLQREFFALDEKNLKTLETVVSEIVKTVGEDLELSLVLTTTVENALYIIIYNDGGVFLRRDGKLLTIGTPEKGTVSAYSGLLKPHDIVFVATGGFTQKVPFDELSQALETDNPHEAGESLAPKLHENASGLEAALTWKVAATPTTAEAANQEEIPEETVPGKKPSNDSLDLDQEETRPHKPSLFEQAKSKAPRVSIASLRRMNRKKLVVIIAILLVAVLGISIFIEKTNRENNKQMDELTTFLSPQQAKYDDAVALKSLNKALADEELTEAQTAVQTKLPGFPKNSPAGKTLQAFLDKVNAALGNTGGSSKINVFFDASKNSQIPSISYITNKNGQLAVIGNKKGGLLGSDGTVTSSFGGTDSVSGITEDDKNVYVLANNTILSIAKSDGSQKTIAKSLPGGISLDNFGSNLYVLSKSDKTIYKYLPNSYSQAPYFVGSVTLSNPGSIAIDSSIYVIDSGKIVKFTRGASDTFTYKGKELSSTSQIYTDVDYTNLYVLDPVKLTATVIDKTGNVVSETSLKGMKNLTSIAADEKSKKMYVVADNKIYSIDF